MTENKKQNLVFDENDRIKKIKILRSNDLFSGDREILIEHQQSYYRLLITKTGKLILNK